MELQTEQQVSLRGSHKPLALRRNMAWVAVSQMITLVAQSGTLILLTKMLSPETVGIFVMGLAICNPVVLFSRLNLRKLQAADVAGEFRFDEYRALRLIMSIVAMAIITTIAIFSSLSPQQIWIVSWIGLAKIIASVSDVYYGLFQANERMDLVAKSMICRAIISLVAIVSIVWFSGQLSYGVQGQALAAILTFVFIDIKHKKVLAQHLVAPSSSITNVSARAKRIADLVRKAVPLGVVSILLSLQLSAPQYIIGHQLGLEHVAYFGALMVFLTGVNQLVNALGNPAIPRLARFYAEHRKGKFVVLTFKLCLVAAAFGGGLVLIAAAAGSQVLRVLYTDAYSQYADEFTVLMLAACLRHIASVLQFAVIAVGRYRGMLVTHVIATLATVIFGILMTTTNGLIGACWAVVVASGTHFVGTLVLVWMAAESMGGGNT